VRRSSYRTGPGAAVAGSGGVFIGALAHGSPAIGQMWRLLREGATAAEIEAAASSCGAAHFALIAGTGEGVVVHIGGAATVSVYSGEESADLSCPRLARMTSTFLERPPARAVLELGGSDEESHVDLPLSAGVVPARSVTTWWATAGGDEQPVPAGVGDSGPDPDPAGEQPAPFLSENTIYPVPEHFEADEDSKADPDPTAVIEVPALIDAVPGVAGDGAGPALGSQFDHLFGMTLYRSVEDAAVRTSAESETTGTPAGGAGAAGTEAGTEEGEGREAAPAGSAPAPPEQPEEPPPPRLSEPVPPPVAAPDRPAPAPAPAPPPAAGGPSGMIDSVPWAGRGQSPVSEVAGGEPADLDHTIHRKPLAAVVPPAAPGPAGPNVHAVRCPQGHLNPPQQSRCRVCGALVEEQAPVTAPRPVLGVLRLPTGDDIVLDRSLLLGRSPAVDRMVNGERPNVVKLPSPGHDISRNHAEVRVDGWHVLIVDLASTNGTVVQRPGRPPERLRPNEPAMIEPGTVVTFADELSLSFLVG
jgi:hypothetical protein